MTSTCLLITHLKASRWQNMALMRRVCLTSRNRKMVLSRLGLRDLESFSSTSFSFRFGSKGEAQLTFAPQLQVEVTNGLITDRLCVRKRKTPEPITKTQPRKRRRTTYTACSSEPPMTTACSSEPPMTTPAKKPRKRTIPATPIKPKSSRNSNNIMVAEGGVNGQPIKLASLRRRLKRQALKKQGPKVVSTATGNLIKPKSAQRLVQLQRQKDHIRTLEQAMSDEQKELRRKAEEKSLRYEKYCQQELAMQNNHTNGHHQNQHQRQGGMLQDHISMMGNYGVTIQQPNTSNIPQVVPLSGPGSLASSSLGSNSSVGGGGLGTQQAGNGASGTGAFSGSSGTTSNPFGATQASNPFASPATQPPKYYVKHGGTIHEVTLDSADQGNGFYYVKLVHGGTRSNGPMKVYGSRDEAERAMSP